MLSSVRTSPRAPPDTTSSAPRGPQQVRPGGPPSPETPLPPPDDTSRPLTVARPDADPSLPHVAVVGDVYTILVSGKQSAGRYAVIDMHVPPGGGPPPHRHDFEEMFTVLDGEVEVTFRGATMKLTAGEPVNV